MLDKKPDGFPAPPAFEIPEEMRDFADRSVEQARRAVDGMLSTAEKAGSLAENSARVLHRNAAELTTSTMRHAQSNIRAAFDLAQALAHARTLEDVARLQADFIKSQIESLREQAGDFGAVVKNAASEAVKPR